MIGKESKTNPPQDQGNMTSVLKKANKARDGSVKMPTEFSEMGFEPKFELFNRSRKEATLSWKDVNLTIGKKQILHDITGQVEAGTVCALMGPSGAGKSSLMVNMFLI